MAKDNSPAQVFDHKLDGKIYSGTYYLVPAEALNNRQRKQILGVTEVISVCGSFQRCKCAQACQTFLVPKTAELPFELKPERENSLRFVPV